MTQVALSYDALLGRQPILNAALEVEGYEVLYRSERSLNADFNDGSTATAVVLTNLLVEFGLKDVVGELPAWVNFPTSYLTEGLPLAGPSELVIELVDLLSVTDELLTRLAELKHKGYRIALPAAELASPELMAVATTAKVDFRTLDLVAPRLPVFRQHHLKLVAERIETMDQLEAAKQHGFDLYQGYFLSRPTLVRKKTPPTSKLSLVRLLAEVQSPRASLKRIEELVAQDVIMSFRLLRYCNSTLFSFPRKIESVQHAIVLLGLDGIRNLVTLLAIGQSEDRPAELMTMALARARACETLAKKLSGLSAETAFTAGLFSCLDAILQRPMEEILESVQLSEELRTGLIHHSGPYGKLIAALTHHERGEFEQLEKLGVTPRDVSRAWLAGVRWANELQQLMSEAGMSTRRKKPTTKQALGAKPR